MAKQNLSSDEIKKYDIDYNKEYKEHLRCPNCNRPTKGEEEYKNIRSNKITKTCIRCRTSVYKSFKKKPRKKKPTQKETIAALYRIIDSIHEDVVKTAIKDKKDLIQFIQPMIKT